MGNPSPLIRAIREIRGSIPLVAAGRAVLCALLAANTHGWPPGGREVELSGTNWNQVELSGIVLYFDRKHGRCETEGNEPGNGGVMSERPDLRNKPGWPGFSSRRRPALYATPSRKQD